MQITLQGQTDKRAVLYTLLKICENLGDCCFITNDRKAMRLMEDGPAESGTYRNIHIYVLDTTADDMWQDIGYAPNDFEYIFLDNLYNEQTNLTIYVKGAGDEQEDLDIIELLEPEEYVTVKMGAPEKQKKEPPELDENGKPVKKPKAGMHKSKAQSSGPQRSFNIPYDKSIPENIEYCEFYKELKPVSSAALQVCATILSSRCGISAKNLGKVGKR